jgi:hypothetical protein
VSIVLTGIDGRNGCGFLAALGVLRLLTDRVGGGARLAWTERGPGRWHPTLAIDSRPDEEELARLVLDAHRERDLDEELGWDKDVMNVAVAGLRSSLKAALDGSGSRRAAETTAACVLDVARLQAGRPHPDALAAYTPLRLIPRVGRARFLDTVLRASAAITTAEPFRMALFGPWRYSKANSLRWDPGASVPLRAYSAEAPTDFGPLGVPGAIVLAAAGLCYFPLLPTGRGRACRGFDNARSLRFRWPIWTAACDEAATRATLSLPYLHDDVPDRSTLARHNVAARVTSTITPLGADGHLLAWGEIDAVTGSPLSAA